MTTLFFALYRALLYPALTLAFRLLAKVNPKVREGLRLRQPDPNGFPPWAMPPRDNSGRRPVWVHCASGEFEYAKPVIRELKRRDPEERILVTYFSPSIRNAVERHPDVDAACPLPWDRPSDLRAFLTHHRPRCLLIARTDTWPEMLRQARKFRIPTLLFSATLAENSGRARGLGRWVSRVVFGFLTDVYCVTSDDRQAFEKLGFGDRAKVAGDTRYDQVQARLAEPKPLRAELFATDDPRPILVAGSTWAEDEEVLALVARKLSDRARFVFVPHEPTDKHLSELEARLKALGLGSVRYSTAEAWAGDDVLVVDRIGILAELYGQGTFAFVGGSFRKTVHSVMEPLAAGCVTFVGPLHRNNREAIEFRAVTARATEPILRCVEAVGSMTAFVERLEAALAAPLRGVPERIKAEIRARSGRSALVADWVEEHARS